MDNIKSLVSGEGEVDPVVKEQMDDYVSSIMYVMHNPKTSESVLKMLAAAPPEQSVPETVMYLNSVVEKPFKEELKGEVPTEVKLAGAAYAVSDLVLLGNAAGVWKEKVSEGKVPELFSGAIKKYVRKGLADGTIDPIELQRETEPLLTEEQKRQGLSFAKALGLPEQPTETMAMEVYATKRSKPIEEENNKLKTLIQQQEQMRQQQEQQKGGSPYGI